MARIARVVVPDFPHHVVQRGVRRVDVVFSADDRQEYVSLLSQSASNRSSHFLAWCLMSNHAHFVVVPGQSKSLSATFGEAHRRYTRMVNVREGWRGHLWQERFHSYPMAEHHLLAAVRYVEMNVKGHPDFPRCGHRKLPTPSPVGSWVRRSPWSPSGGRP